MSRIAVFDFDGTITKNDTFIEFLRYTHNSKFYLTFTLLLPILVLYKIGIIPNYRAKEWVISVFYKGWSLERLREQCRSFVDHIPLRDKAIEALKEHQKSGDVVVIISASPENWVKEWGSKYGVEHVLATKLEVNNGVITGKLRSRNCYGAEKVCRFKDFLGRLKIDRSQTEIIAYGDSLGDKELLDYSDTPHYRVF